MSQDKKMLMPKEPQIGIVEVLETRSLTFNRVFDMDFCMEVADVLGRVMQYDKLVGTPKDKLYIRIAINSPGGYLHCLMQVIEKVELMKQQGYTVHTHVVGDACSCGFFLYCGGNYKTMSPFASLMNHQPSCASWGTLREQQISVEHMRKVEAQLRQYVKDNTRLSQEECDKPYNTNSDVWYTANEALELGLADELRYY